MATKIIVQARQLLDADKSTFRDVSKRFREVKDLLFIVSGNQTIGVISQTEFWKAYYNNTKPNTRAVSIMNPNYPFINSQLSDKDQAARAAEIFSNGEYYEIPVAAGHDVPEYMLARTNFQLRQAFYCNVLTGLSTYNLSINADLTVSCHCVLRSAGELGHLRDESLMDIYSSDRVKTIREMLYNGVLPTYGCILCPDLVSAPNSLAKYYSEHYTLPKGIMVENTSVCNLKCKNCYNAVIENATISVEDMEKIAKQLADVGVQRISLFKYGETFADQQLHIKLDILKKYLPDVKVSVSTNGMLINNKHAIESALKLNHLTVSLDGVNDETVQEFQIGSKFEQVFENIKALTKVRNERQIDGLTISWKMVLFAHNFSPDIIDTAFSKATELDIENLQFLDGWNVRDSERTNAIHNDLIFHKYMERYDFNYNHSGGGTLTFYLKRKVL